MTLWQKLLKNWQVKVLCFVSALLLYLGRTWGHLDRKTFVVPLDVVSSGAVSTTTKPPEFVTITIRSTPENIAEVMMTDLSASLDLTPFISAGEYPVPVTVRLSPKVLMMSSVEVRMKPEHVRMKVEKRVVKYIAVEPSVVGEVAHGYEISEIEAVPDFVQVAGPKSVVDALKSVSTGMVDVSSLIDSEDYEVELGEISPFVKMSFSKASSGERKSKCAVHVEVSPQSMSRTFLGVAVKPLFLDSGLSLAGEILPITFDVEGTVPSLENFILGEDAVTVNCSNIAAPGSYTLPVKISLPYPLKLRSRSTETVHITVQGKAHNSQEGAHGAAKGAA